jgi:hypothetical protein
MPSCRSPGSRIGSVASVNQTGEALTILITRRAFVDCIVADPSTHTSTFGTRPAGLVTCGDDPRNRPARRVKVRSRLKRLTSSSRHLKIS